MEDVLERAVSFIDKKIANISEEIKKQEQELETLKIPTQEEILHMIEKEIASMNQHKKKIHGRLERVSGKDEEVAKQINERIQFICHALERAGLI